MTVDPRAALDRLIAALEAHYSAVTVRRSDDDPGVDDAYYVLADAFDVYDESLGLAYGEATPFIVADDDDDDIDTVDTQGDDDDDDDIDTVDTQGDDDDDDEDDDFDDEDDEDSK